MHRSDQHVLTKTSSCWSLEILPDICRSDLAQLLSAQHLLLRFPLLCKFTMHGLGRHVAGGLVSQPLPSADHNPIILPGFIVLVIEAWSSIRNINRDKKVPFATQTVDCFIEQVYKKGHMK
ncbi:hypothetical protein Peur_055568 [Populus x canadensis]